jgi:hypothetical protein
MILSSCRTMHRAPVRLPSFLGYWNDAFRPMHSSTDFWTGVISFARGKGQLADKPLQIVEHTLWILMKTSAKPSSLS